jgi:hypothetical protein
MELPRSIGNELGSPDRFTPGPHPREAFDFGQCPHCEGYGWSSATGRWVCLRCGFTICSGGVEAGALSTAANPKDARDTRCGKPRNATLRCLTRNGGLSADQRLCRRRSGCPSPCRSSDRPAAISFGSAEHTHQNKAVKRAVSASRRSYLTRQTGEENSSLTGAPPVRPPHETEGDPAPFKAPARTGMICSGLSDPKGRVKGGRTLTGVADTSNAPADASAPQKRVLRTVNARVLRRHDSRRDGNLPNWSGDGLVGHPTSVMFLLALRPELVAASAEGRAS